MEVPDFFALAAAAVTARRDADSHNDSAGRNRTPPTCPMLSGIDDCRFYRGRESQESPDLAVRLWHRLRVFNDGSAVWGLVDDWRPDGSPYKRPGVVVTLRVKLRNATNPADRERHIREAIDFVLLAMPLDPQAIMRVISRRRNSDRGHVDYEDELNAVARGVPWKLRLSFQLDGRELDQLQPLFSRDFMEKYDRELSDDVFMRQRQELSQAVTDHEHPALARVAQVAAHSTLRAELINNTGGHLEKSLIASEDFFEQLSAFLVHLDRYESHGETRRWSKRAPFRVEKVVLKLGQLHVTANSHQLAKTLLKSRIPVHLAKLSLDFRLISCSETDFRKFVQTITAGATDLVVDNGDNYRARQMIATDAEGQNRSNRIRWFIAVIAEIKSIHTLNIGGMFAICEWPHNRDALWCSLFEDVVSRDEPLVVLKFRVGVVKQMVFLARDGASIAAAAARWRQENPHKKLRVRHVELHFQRSDMGAIRSFLSSLSEAETLSLKFCSSERAYDQDMSTGDLIEMLQVSSLRAIEIMNLTIPTLDVFNPAIPDSRLLNRPSLTKILLSPLNLEEVASLPRFLDQLKQTAGVSNKLADTMEFLDIRTVHNLHIFDDNCRTILDDALASNNKLRYVGISIPPTDKKDEKLQSEMLRKHLGRHLPPSAAEKRSAIVLVRNGAFLSTICNRYGTAARCQLDSTAVSKIFAFSAPHATRRTSEVPIIDEYMCQQFPYRWRGLFASTVLAPYLLHRCTCPMNISGCQT